MGAVAVVGARPPQVNHRHRARRRTALRQTSQGTKQDTEAASREPTAVVASQLEHAREAYTLAGPCNGQAWLRSRVMPTRRVNRKAAAAAAATTAPAAAAALPLRIPHRMMCLPGHLLPLRATKMCDKRKDKKTKRKRGRKRGKEGDGQHPRRKKRKQPSRKITKGREREKPRTKTKRNKRKKHG